MTTRVMKFGGTSVGNADALTQVAEIVLEHEREGDRIAVVVSAMNGVTDALIQGARTAAFGDHQTYQKILSELRARHQHAVNQLISLEGERKDLWAIVDQYLGEFATLCHSISVLGEVTPRAMDAVTSIGERMIVRILACLFGQYGMRCMAMDATELIVTDAKFQNAVPRMDITRERVSGRLLPLLMDGIVPVVTGFIGATEEGITTTLGRGGSDYSAAILSDCLEADEVWIWTDVDGVMAADPNLVPDARVIPVLSYSEVSEMAYFGAKVLHPKTIRPIIERGTPLWVKNTFRPASSGTQIVRDPLVAGGKIKAVTAIKGLSMLTVEGRGMLGVPGIAARTFSAVAGQGVSVLMISQASSEQSICFVIPSLTVAAVIHAIEEEMELELARGDIDRVWSWDDVVIVTAVGAGLRKTPGIDALIFGALGRASINVIAIAQGSSECSLSLVLEAEDAAQAIEHIHREVILNG